MIKVNVGTQEYELSDGFYTFLFHANFDFPGGRLTIREAHGSYEEGARIISRRYGARQPDADIRLSPKKIGGELTIRGPESNVKIDKGMEISEMLGMEGFDYRSNALSVDYNRGSVPVIEITCERQPRSYGDVPQLSEARLSRLGVGRVESIDHNTFPVSNIFPMILHDGDKVSEVNDPMIF